jgi:hypothetical protein
MAIWYILQPLGKFYDNLVYLVVLWYISSRSGTLCQEKSGKPVSATSSVRTLQPVFNYINAF